MACLQANGKGGDGTRDGANYASSTWTFKDDAYCAASICTFTSKQLYVDLAHRMASSQSVIHLLWLAKTKLVKQSPLEGYTRLAVA